MTGRSSEQVNSPQLSPHLLATSDLRCPLSPGTGMYNLF